jgi:Lrp/AsnC family transcriptional regulator, leucine-responsive regulatory protein
MKLDAIDRRILAALQRDARLSNVDLAQQVGLSASPCLRRVRLLEAAGILQGYRAILDRGAIGLGLTVFAGVKVERHSEAHAEAFTRTVLEMNEVVACHLVSGEVDFLLEIVVPDMATYENAVLRGLLTLPAVREVRSNFAMRTYKADAPLPMAPLDRS